MAPNKRLLKLLQTLVSIDSQNPPGNEKPLALFVKRYLERLGLTVRLYEFKKGRTNLIATLAARPTARHSLLITPHLDTVPAGKNWRMDPFAGAVRHGKMYGLGATDCKVNLACAMEAINRIVEKKESLGYTLVLAATADEETGSALGLIPLLDRGILRPDCAVILDADDFDIVVVQKGLLHLKIKIAGKRAHGAYPWLGVNAIEKMMDVLEAVKAYGFTQTTNAYLRPPTVNVGTIRGGDKVNIVADWCECEIDVRFLPGTDGRRVVSDIRRVARRHGRNAHVEVESLQKPYCISERHPLVQTLARTMRANGIPVRIRGSEGATTITFFQEHRIPAVATGFGHSGCAHTADEYCSIASLEKGAGVVESFLKKFTFTG